MKIRASSGPSPVRSRKRARSDLIGSAALPCRMSGRVPRFQQSKGQRRSPRTADKFREPNIDARIQTSRRRSVLVSLACRVPCLCKHVGRCLRDHVALLDTKGDTSAARASHAIVGELGNDQVYETSRCARSASLLANAAIQAVRHRREGLTNGRISAVALPSQPVDGPTFGRSPCAQTFVLDSSP